MKARQWYWPVVLLVAALFVPAGLGAQEAPPAPPAPPEPPVWIGSMPGGNSLQIITTPAAAEGWLGMTISEVSNAEAQQAKLRKLAGVYVNSVKADSPAAKAGVKAHDIIVEYNGHSVEGVLQFQRLVRETPPGRSVSMRVWRGGRSQVLSAKVERRHTLFESRFPMTGRMQLERPPFTLFRGLGMHPLLGVRAQEVSGQLGSYFQAPGGRGVLVVSVDANSAAQKAGIKAGDVIYQVAGKPVGTTVELEQALRKNCSANGVSLGVVRKGVTLQVRAPIDCPQEPGSVSSTTVTTRR